MKSFRIRNVKAFVDSGDIEIAPITIFVGKNSCGKSSLIRFPAVLAQTSLEDSESPIAFFGKMLDYGNYEDVIHRHKNTDFSYSVEYEMDINHFPFLNSNMRHRSGVSDNGNQRLIKACRLTVSIGKLGRNLIVKTMELELDGKTTYRIRNNSGKYIYELECIREENGFSLLERPIEFSVSSVMMSSIPLVRVSQEHIAEAVEMYLGIKSDDPEKKAGSYLEHSRRYGTNMENDEDYNEADKLAYKIDNTIEHLRLITTNIRRLIDMEAMNMCYIGPFRQDPERYYRDMSRNTGKVGTRGENVSTMLINDYHREESLIRKISEWLHEALGYRITLKDMGSNLFQIMIVDDKGFQSNIMDVGYGVSQVLPIVAAVFQSMQGHDLAYGGCEEIMIVEQPELHLHPAAQAELAQLFAACVRGTRRSTKRKLLIETHSEHLIRKLQVLIANPEYPLTRNMVKIYYIDKNAKDNEATVKEMKICDDGRFEEEWPTGFFDKAFELSMELAEY